MVDLNELRNNYILIILVLVSYQRVSWSREQGAESWEQAGLESGALQQSGQSGQRCGAGNISQGHLSALLCHGTTVPEGKLYEIPQSEIVIKC